MSEPCQDCAKFEKLARDYAELNSKLYEENKRLAFRLREVRRLLSPLEKMIAGLKLNANPN